MGSCAPCGGWDSGACIFTPGLRPGATIFCPLKRATPKPSEGTGDAPHENGHT